jgi:type I restriction enzyme S subunit
MNPAQLLAHFDRISDAPDAVSRLRKFILDLAVRGKLVVQKLNDEPATTLIRQIAAERANCAKANTTRLNNVTSSTPSNGEVPFTLPSSWVSTHLSDLSLRIHYGYTASAKPEVIVYRLT